MLVKILKRIDVNLKHPLLTPPLSIPSFHSFPLQTDGPQRAFERWWFVQVWQRFDGDSDRVDASDVRLPFRSPSRRQTHFFQLHRLFIVVGGNPQTYLDSRYVQMAS